MQVLEAVKSQSKPVAAPELLGCMKILMVAIKRFLPLVLATRKKDGWLSAIWVANSQEKLIIDSKQEVIYHVLRFRCFIMKLTYHVVSNI